MRCARSLTRLSNERTRALTAPQALLLALLALAAAAMPAPASGAGPHPQGLGLSLTAQPINGSVPLVVAFRATVSPSSSTATFSWTFGDGSSYEEVATGYSAVEHEYLAPGAFSANVFVASPSGDGNATVLIQALPDSLGDAISATPLSGTAPLTVQFQALPSGGTGTYTTILWQFGDGDNGSGANLAYTYVRAGDFNVTLTVTDSAGATASASVEIRVHAASSGSGSAPDGPVGGTWVVPIALVLVVVAIALASYRWLLRRPAATPPVPPHPPTPPPVPSGTAPEGPPTPEAMEQASSSPVSGVEESRRLSKQLLVHLYWHGRATTEGVATVDASQAGMARRFGVTQNAVSKALNRLIESGTVKAELRHVPGASRRLKTYSLTPRGEAVARTLRVDGNVRRKA